MSQVHELVGQIEAACQHSPDLLDYRTSIREVLSDVHDEVCLARPWPFLEEMEPVFALPDITIANNQLAVIGPRTFEFSVEAILEGTLYDEVDGDVHEHWQTMLEGSEFHLADISGRAAGVGNWQLAPFIIDRVAPAESGVFRVWLDERANITSLAAGLGDFEIRSPRIRLPSRCNAVLSIVDSETHVPLETLPQTMWRQYAVDPERTGSQPLWWFHEAGFSSRLPSYVGGPAEVLVGGSELLKQRKNAPIYEGDSFTMAASSGGTLLADTVYRVFVCWTYGGRYGPPSEVESATTTSVNKTLTITALPVKEAGAGTDLAGDTGHRLAVFVAEGDYGPFFEHDVKSDGFATTHTISARVQLTKTKGQPDNLRRWDRIYPGGPYNYLRLWPRTNATRRLELNYLRHPTRLISNVDEPDIPQVFQKLLVHGTVIEMAARFNRGASLIAMHTKLYQERFDMLCARYSGDEYQRIIKSVYGAPPVRGLLHPTTLTYRNT